ncbi:MAG: D-glucuronyl C5-epimerase family protein [Solirubrobacteraceae bacterium]
MLLCVVFPAPGYGAPLLVLGPHGQVSVRSDPALRGTPSAPAPGAIPRRAVPRAVIADRNVRSELVRLARTHAITPSAYHRYLGSFNSALNAEARLSGTRAVELEAVIENLHAIAASGLLTPSRLPVLFLTLDKNRSWWVTGPLLASGQRVSFAGSQLVWEYYPGQGIELQQLGSWGQVDWMYQARGRYWPRLLRLVNELIPLAAYRGGGYVWEYYFNFDGGAPPWTSAMSQGTAIQALTQAYEASHQKRYIVLARRSLPIFTRIPPFGVSVPTPLGSRYLQYSFAPGRDVEVINGFLQSLIGLFDYARATRNPEGWRLFRAGDAEARAELPSYNAGGWSYYQPGQLDSVDYHTLVTQFLAQLCARTHAHVYCATAAQFQADLTTPPVLALFTRKVRVNKPVSLSFSVSKPARVGITIVDRGQTTFLTSADFASGTAQFAVPAFTHTGLYTVRLDATDLAGNYHQMSSSVSVTR